MRAGQEDVWNDCLDALEGDLSEIFAFILRMEEAVFALGADRVGTVIKVDDRRDRGVAMAEKVESVERLLEVDS